MPETQGVAKVGVGVEGNGREENVKPPGYAILNGFGTMANLPHS